MSQRSQWSEYKNADGRVYWSHALTKQSVWEKPDELKTPFEKALAKTQWKQYTSKDRPYYVNAVTKETKWDLPPELVALKEQVEEEEIRKAEREKRKEQGIASPSPSPHRESRSPTPEDIRELRASAANALALYKQPSSAASAATPSKPETPDVTRHQDLPVIVMPSGGFNSRGEAEEAFTYLLKREGVNETWTWDQTMRKIVLDPLYNALDTLAEKKAVFEKFIGSILEERRAAKEDRINRLRPIFHKMFTKSGVIKPYSTLNTADQAFARDKYWREAFPEEKRLILEEYTDKLRREQESAEKALRNRNIQILTDLIPTLSISVSTRWRAAHDLIISSPEFQSDRDLQKVEALDMIKVYEDYIYKLEQEHKEESRKLKIEHTRNARKAREGFKALLKELEEKGHLTRTTKFKDTYPLINSDQRYIELLGLPGSSPLDLWMDAVDDISEEVERASDKIEMALSKVGKKMKLETSWKELEEWCKEVHLDTQISEKLRMEVYKLIQHRLKQVVEEESRRAERRRRHRIDDLRYALKKVEDISIDMTYEQTVPYIKDLPEFKDVTDEEDRIVAWEKFVRRQKEKAAEAESSKSHRDRGTERVKDREREKERKTSKDVGMDEDENRSHNRHGEREREDRDGYRSYRDDRIHRDRSSRRDDRERERDRDRDSDNIKEKDRERDRRDRDRDRERDKTSGRDRDRERDRKHASDFDNEREHKRRRLSSTSAAATPPMGPKKKDDEEMEEGEI
ncbi:hypothetical protein L204_105946 [Cryptococcus depauperatus]|nr:pre-mRNA-processing factor 40 [Cryptococcus depauperatus CBS 7855]